MPHFFEKITKEDLRQHRVSTAALVAANAVPLLGVLFLDWSTFEIVLLYWFENVVLGVLNVMRMLACSPDADQLDLSKLLHGQDEAETQQAIDQIKGLVGNPWAMHGAKFFFVPFFTVHYGVFCLVHGVFVFVLLGNGGLMQGGPGPDFGRVDVNPNLLLAALALTGSHVVSFFVNYLGRGEYRRTILPALMVAPYGRIVVLHVAIVLGAFTVIALGSPVFLLAILIVGKTLMDLSLHLREHHEKPNDSTEGVMTTVEPGAN